jgi:hypothetical protein
MTVAVFIVFVCLIIASTAQPISCFIAQFPPTTVDVDSTEYNYDIDVLTPAPLLLSFDLLEFGPVTNDACTRQGGADAIVLKINKARASFWPTHCSDQNFLSFSVSNLADTHWGLQHMLSSAVNGKRLAPQHGRVDFVTGKWSYLQPTTSLRSVSISLYSKGTRRFMPSFDAQQAPLIVRVCIATRDVPADIGIYAPVDISNQKFVLPFASCIYEDAGLCGTNLGYCSTADIALHAHTPDNSISPSRLENGWELPRLYVQGCLATSQAPTMHVGWICEMDDVIWNVNGSVLRLNAQSPRCANSPMDTETDSRILAAMQKGTDPLIKISDVPKRHPVTTVKMEDAQRIWKAAGVKVDK